MGLLDGKKIVITGVLTDASLAYGVAQLARAEGADIVLTGAGRALKLTQRTARKLGDDIDVYELDVTVPEHGTAVREALEAKWGHVDGVLHAIGFAPEVCLGDDFLAAQWDDVAVAMHISTYSLKALADAFLPLMGPGGSFVGLDFDNQQAWPAYNWMGVAKSALQSVSRVPRQGGRPPRHPLEPGGGRTDQDDGGEVDPRFLASSRTSGTTGRHSVGTSPTPSRSPAPSSRCCPTGSPPRPARSSTSTAATTPSVPDPVADGTPVDAPRTAARSATLANCRRLQAVGDVHRIRTHCATGDARRSRGRRAVRFYEGVLGVSQVPKPTAPRRRGGCWFELGDLKIHLGVDGDFRPARKAHPALLVDDLARLIADLAAAGVDVTDDEPLEGYDRVYVDDPFGNRIELLEPTPTIAFRPLTVDDLELLVEWFADPVVAAWWDQPAEIESVGPSTCHESTAPAIRR